jgi:hypothetical protein
MMIMLADNTSAARCTTAPEINVSQILIGERLVIWNNPISTTIYILKEWGSEVAL